MLPTELKDLVIKFLYLVNNYNNIKNNKLINNNFKLQYLTYHYGLNLNNSKVDIASVIEKAESLKQKFISKNIYPTVASFTTLLFDIDSKIVNILLDRIESNQLFSVNHNYMASGLNTKVSKLKLNPNSNLLQDYILALSQPTSYLVTHGLKTVNFNIDNITIIENDRELSIQMKTIFITEYIKAYSVIMACD